MINGLFLIVLSIIVSVLPLFMVKKYIETDNVLYIMSAVLMYGLLIYLYYRLFCENDMCYIYPLIKIASVVLMVLLGIVYFGEGFNNYKFAGIIMGIMSIVLLSY